MLWRHGPSRDWVEQHLAMLVARIATRHRRVQRDLDRIASIWAPPAHLHLCLGGWVHWQVPATTRAVAAVAAHACDADVGVRHAVAAALIHAAPHTDAALPALRVGLIDVDRRVRILAARAVGRGLVDASLRPLLLDAIHDPIWTVRWHAAAALHDLGVEALPSHVLRATVPRPGRALEGWLEAAGRVAPDTALAATIARARSDLETCRALWLRT